jgi:RHS repeat-associated protein
MQAEVMPCKLLQPGKCYRGSNSVGRRAAGFVRSLLDADCSHSVIGSRIPFRTKQNGPFARMFQTSRGQAPNTINRYYDPSTGQFLSVDPAVAQTGQPYAFTGDDPLNGMDPLGLMVLRPEADNPTFAEVIARPGLIRGWTPNEVQEAFGTTKGVKLSRLSRGSAKGQGLKLNEENAEGTDVTDQSISYHPPDVGHHVEDFPDGYYKVSSGEGGTVRIPASRPTGALPIPGDETDGFGHALPGNFDSSAIYDPLVEDPPTPTVGFWGMLNDAFFGGGDDDG